MSEPRGQCERLAGLLHGAEERWRYRGDAFVCSVRSGVATAVHKASSDGMASVGGDVAGDDRDDFEMAWGLLCKIKTACNVGFAVSSASAGAVFTKIPYFGNFAFSVHAKACWRQLKCSS